jgi:hypothetical protein
LCPVCWSLGERKVVNDMLHSVILDTYSCVSWAWLSAQGEEARSTEVDCVYVTSVRPTQKNFIQVEKARYIHRHSTSCSQASIQQTCCSCISPFEPLRKGNTAPLIPTRVSPLPYLPTRVTVNYAVPHPAWNCTMCRAP